MKGHKANAGTIEINNEARPWVGLNHRHSDQRSSTLSLVYCVSLNWPQYIIWASRLYYVYHHITYIQTLYQLTRDHISTYYVNHHITYIQTLYQPTRDHISTVLRKPPYHVHTDVISADTWPHLDLLRKSPYHVHTDVISADTWPHLDRTT